MHGSEDVRQSMAESDCSVNMVGMKGRRTEEDRGALTVRLGAEGGLKRL